MINLQYFEKYKLIAIIVIISTVFSLIFSLNFFTKYLADDFTYGYAINSVKDIFISQYRHWYEWGGRNVAHFLVQFFMLYDKMLFNVCNSLIYVCFTLLIYVHSIGIKCKIYIYIIINLLLWYYLAVWGEVILWLTGSCNYLWTSTICLLFLLPFRFNLANKINMNEFQSFCMMILGILSGWSNENTGAAIFASIVIYIIYKKHCKLSFKYWEINGIAGFIVGYTLLISAPGNYIRASSTINKDLYNILIQNIEVCLKRISISWYPILFFTLISILYHKEIKKKFSNFYVSIIYLFAALVSHFSMIISPEFPPRSTMPVVFFGIIALCNLLSELELKQNRILIRFLSLIYFYIVMIDFPMEFYSTLKEAIDFYNYDNKLVAHVVEEKNKGNLDIVIQQIARTKNKHSPLYRILYFNEYKDSYQNSNFAKYYGLNSIIAITNSEL